MKTARAKCPTCGAVKRGRPSRSADPAFADAIVRCAEAYARLGTLREVARIAKQQRWRGGWSMPNISKLLRRPDVQALLAEEHPALALKVIALFSRGRGRPRKGVSGEARSEVS